MFESDDFDEVLSQFDLPQISISSQIQNENICTSQFRHKAIQKETPLTTNINMNTNIKDCSMSEALAVIKSSSPKQTKRKILNSYFDHSRKRKFPGPAGLLNSTLEEPRDESISRIELLSQDINFSQRHLSKGIFDSPIWNKLENDLKDWNLSGVDTVKTIKQQALTGNLRMKKAQIVTAFVETVDRSAIDPLIILRDSTGNIKCTLHRDAWSKFSHYIISEICALVLWKPTVLTTGAAFKKHYLNITLSNILAVYSSTEIRHEDAQLLDGYVIKTNEDFIVISRDASSLAINSPSSDLLRGNDLEELDSIFSDDMF